MFIPPCISTDVRIPCASCNRKLRSRACFEKHKTHMLKGMPVCLQNRNYGKFNSPTLPMHKHECFKRYCAFCQKNREAGHYCYMRPLKNEPPKSENVLFVFYDFETTQDTQLTASATVHIPNNVCIQQFCALCEKEPDSDVDCVRCGTRRHALSDDPVGDLLAFCVSSASGVRRLLQSHITREASMRT